MAIIKMILSFFDAAIIQDAPQETETIGTWMFRIAVNIKEK